MKKHFLLVSAMCFSSSLFAADGKGQFAVKGIGNTSCSTYVTEVSKETPNSFLYAGWLNGYLTAQNQQLNDTFDLISWETVNTLGNYLVSYCKKNPKQSFYMATSSMLGGLYEHRISSFSPALTVKSDNGSVRVYKSIIQEIQRVLAKKGLYKGDVNGQYNKQTLKAVKAYQKKMGLTVSGLPDQATLFKLLPKNQ